MTVIDASGAVHPRPQLTRAEHEILDGVCGFAFDPDDRGLRERWMDDAAPFEQTIRLPFSPESEASGIGDTGFHPVVWYRIDVSSDQISASGWPTQGERLFVNFGAVDRVADVWFDGERVTHHEGGHTAFTVDVTEALDLARPSHVLVVRAYDDPFDLEAARGKQDWQESPHSIWYHRSTGIVRSVWLEAVPDLHAVNIAWTARPQQHTVGLDVELSRRARRGSTVTATVSLEGRVLGTVATDVDGDHVMLEVSVPALRNGQGLEEICWSPDSPVLIDAEIVIDEPPLAEPTGDSPPSVSIDRVQSYFGLRSVQVEGRVLLLNDRPFVVRAVLEQGYWSESHYTAPSELALREEVELIKRLGFNSVRIHQKIEDPRFLYWCDRLGVCVWSEAPAAYDFTPRAVERFTSEWVRSVRAAASHPSVMVWVPVNESWGLQQISHDPQQRAFSRALADLTRALDGTRPVVSNDGWEHTDSDLATVHDYDSSPAAIRERYRDATAVDTLLTGIGPAGRRMGTGLIGKPVILSEFGGIRFDIDASDGTWGYSTVSTSAEFETRLRELLEVVVGAGGLQGFCYTQLTDTAQETNGLCDSGRKSKIPEERIRSMVLGEH